MDDVYDTDDDHDDDTMLMMEPYDYDDDTDDAIDQKNDSYTAAWAVPGASLLCTFFRSRFRSVKLR